MDRPIRLHVLLGAIAATVAPSVASALDCPPAQEQWKGGAIEADRRSLDCLAESPTDPGRLFARSQVLGWLGRHAEALERVDEAIGLAPFDRDLQLWRVRVLGWLGRFDEASAALEAVPAPTDEAGETEVAKLRGDLAYWRGDHQGAIAAYSAYLEKEEGDLQTRRALGISRLRVGAEGEGRQELASLCVEGDRDSCVVIRDRDAIDAPTPTSFFLQAGPNTSERISGWSLLALIETAPSEALSLRGGLELHERTVADVRAGDLVLGAGALLKTTDWLLVDLGGSVTVDPEFSPDWSAHTELGFVLGKGFTLFARYWHIEFARAGVEVLSPAIVYEGRGFWASARLWRSFDPSGDGIAGLAQAGVSLLPQLQLSAGVGGGDKADYLEVRDRDTAGHVVGLVGLAWKPSEVHGLRLDYIGRRETVGDEGILRHEILAAVVRRW